MIDPRPLHVTFDPVDLGISLAVAIVAAYSAFSLLSRATRQPTVARRMTLRGSAGLVMGVGLGTMHFIGMLGVDLPMRAWYAPGEVASCYLLAIVGSVAALGIATRGPLTLVRWMVATLVFATGIIANHFLGMEAMRGAFTIGNAPSYVVASALCTLVGAGGALYLACRPRSPDGWTGALNRAASGLLLGIAVTAAHIVALAGVRFYTIAAAATGTDLMDDRAVYVMATVTALAILATALFAAGDDQRAHREREAAEAHHRVRESVLTQAIETRQAEATRASTLYQLLAENALDMVSTHTADGTFSYASPSWLEFLAMSSERMIGLAPLEFCHPDDASLLLKNYAAALHSRKPIRTLWRGRRWDGGWRWLDTLTRPVAGEDGRVRTFVCATRDVTEARQLEESLNQERRFLGALVDSLSEGILATDAEGHTLLINKAIRQQFGAILDSLDLSRAVDDFHIRGPDGVTPLDPSRLPLVRALGGESVRDYVMVVETLAGADRFVSVSAEPVVDETGRTLGGVVASRDITEQRLAQQALEESELRFRTASDSSFDMFIILEAVRDQRGEIVDFVYREVNKSMEQTIGVPRAEILGRRMTDVFPFTREGNHVAKFAHVVETRASLSEEVEANIPGRFHGWVYHEIVPLGDGVALTSRDVTPRRQAEAKLRASEARNRQLVELAADAIIVITPHGVVVEANARACALLHYEREEMIGLALGTLVARDKNGKMPSLQQPHGGDVVTGEYWVVRRDGTRLPVEVSAGLQPDGMIQVIARDITSRKELDRLKDEFVSMVSHELRTPLTSIRGALGLLAAGKLDAAPDKRHRMLDLAVTNTDRLIRLINDILDVERIDSGAVAMDRAWTDGVLLAQQVVDALKPVAERSGVELVVEGGTVRTWGDADRITQTLTNLVGNAIKFSPSGSTVTVTITDRRTDVLFEVRDQGRGIPPDKITFIFERFHQVDASDARDKGGTGLGLAICRSIVQQHGGRIWVESEVGRGSTFRFTLPRPVDTDSDETSGILVCDDDPAFLEVVSELLRQQGYHVRTATSGDDAVRKATTHRPQAILLDMVMPGLGGRETLAMLRAREGMHDVPVIVISGLEREAGTRAMAVSDWLSKPLDQQALLHALEKALPGRGTRGTRVLVVEDDIGLMQVIAATLEARGFTVATAHRGLDAIARFDADGADALVIDISLPDISGLEVLERIASRGHGDVPAIIYTAMDLSHEQRRRVRGAGGVIATKSHTSPEELVAQVAKLLDLASKHPDDATV